MKVLNTLKENVFPSKHFKNLVLKIITYLQII